MTLLLIITIESLDETPARVHLENASGINILVYIGDRIEKELLIRSVVWVWPCRLRTLRPNFLALIAKFPLLVHLSASLNGKLHALHSPKVPPLPMVALFPLPTLLKMSPRTLTFLRTALRKCRLLPATIPTTKLRLVPILGQQDLTILVIIGINLPRNNPLTFNPRLRTIEWWTK